MESTCQLAKDAINLPEFASQDEATKDQLVSACALACGEPCPSAAQQEKTIQFHNSVIQFEASSSQDKIIAAYFHYVMSLKDDAVNTDDLGDFHPSQALQIDAMLKRTYVDQSKIRQSIHNTVISTTE